MKGARLANIVFFDNSSRSPVRSYNLRYAVMSTLRSHFERYNHYQQRMESANQNTNNRPVIEIQSNGAHLATMLEEDLIPIMTTSAKNRVSWHMKSEKWIKYKQADGTGCVIWVYYARFTDVKYTHFKNYKSSRHLT